MDLAGKVIVVTGGASGIGAALAHAFAQAGARHVAVADIADAGPVADAVGGSAHRTDVTREADVHALAATVEAAHGPIGLFVSNAGVIRTDPDFENAASAPNADWALSWAVNVMAHVYAARAVLPGMVARREGWLLNTVSAAGLLSQIGAASYSATKHAAIGFAESLAITHRDHGIGVSVLCPQGVDTPLVPSGFFAGADVDGVLTAAQVADVTLAGLAEGRFLILPHPKVAGYFLAKAENYPRWLGGMAKLRRRVLATPPAATHTPATHTPAAPTPAAPPPAASPDAASPDAPSPGGRARP